MAETAPLFRRTMEPHLRRLVRQYPVVFLTGPRQSGKTTLSRVAFPRFAYSSLEDIDEREFARADPRGFLARFEGKRGVVLDEVQRVPELFSYLQGVADRPGLPDWFSPDHSSSSCHAASGRRSPVARRYSRCFRCRSPS